MRKIKRLEQMFLKIIINKQKNHNQHKIKKIYIIL